MTFGEQNTLSQSFRILDGAFHDGINFFDELYPVPQREETQGRSEYFGLRVKERRIPRDRVVIATTDAGPSGPFSWIQRPPKSLYTRIEPRIKEFESPLSFEISDVRSIGICGMGGIGKTTLAKAVFDHYRSKFECSFFLENMRDMKYTLSHSHVLKQFLSQVSAEEYGNVAVLPSLCKSKLRTKRIQIVLDDVSDLSELESFFTGDEFLCGKGSRIIITTRDRSMLLKYGVDMIYEVGGLNGHEALKLFSLNAFKQHPRADDYLKLSRKVVEFTKRVPVPLKVLDSFLYGKNIQEWEFRLQKLKSIPNQEILNKLKVRFDALDEEERKIFLDIDCFFRGEKINRVKRILEGSYFSADIGISLLTDKCLLYISNNKLEMHDLLQSMGREIVRQKCGVHLLYSEVEGETGFPKPACSPPFNNLSTSASECNFREVDKGQGPHSKRCRRGYLYDEAQPSRFIPCEG